METADVICHSKAPNGEELITVEIQAHRFILAEINTHRVLSRNYQSSRAVPVPKMLQQVSKHPAIPVHFGKNQRGMVADQETDAPVYFLEDSGINRIYTGEEAWRAAAKSAARYAKVMHEAGYHKQIVNRIIEPFIWTKGVITATRTGWDSVFKLRCHKDAQPEFRSLAEILENKINNSTPKMLDYGEWHLPYVEDKILSLKEAIMVSCSCCAQVSYRTLDTSLDKAQKIYDMLNLPENGQFKTDPPHFSPAEHVAQVNRDWTGTPSDIGGNFQTTTFYQYRKMLEQGIEGEVLNA